MHKYNLTFKRIFIRLLLAGLVGIIFGIAMFPFLRVADRLLYNQKVAVGGENIFRMIILWGLFTAVVFSLTFWRKRFRMVAVFLLGCWFLSLVLGCFVLFQSKPQKYCKRSSPYDTPKEIIRALDLISQRLGIDEKAEGSLIQNAFNYINCLDIKYLQTDSADSEAYFVNYKDSDLQDLKIFLNPSYKEFDDLTLATVLTHELVHAGQGISENIYHTEYDCYKSEAQAYTSQAMFIDWLNEEERRSIYTRLQDNAYKNPAFTMLLLTGKRKDESYFACQRLQKENDLSQEQFNKCVWEGLQNKMEKDVRASPEYQKQCDLNK